MPSVALNPLSDADRTGYTGDNGDLANILMASAAVDQMVAGIPYAFAEAPNAPPASYPFSVRWPSEAGGTFKDLVLDGKVGGASGTRLQIIHRLQIFVAEGPISADRAALQNATLGRIQTMLKSYKLNTTLGATPEGRAICHKCDLTTYKWATIPYGRDGQNNVLRHLGWLFDAEVECRVFARRG